MMNHEAHEKLPAPSRERNSFKGISVLVCVVLVVGCVLFVQKCRKSILHNRMVSVSSNGRVLLIAMAVDTSTWADDNGGMSNATYFSDWPRPWETRGEMSSTEYFNTLITNIAKNLAPSFFAGPGVPCATGSTMKACNNSWCIVELFDDEYTNRNFPLLFTRNIAITNLSCGEDVSLSDEAPFGRKGAVIITATAALTFNEKEIKEFFSTLDASNRVMRP